jgi:hypothetical protein
VHKEGGQEAAGRVTVAWVYAELIGYKSTLVAGGWDTNTSLDPRGRGSLGPRLKGGLQLQGGGGCNTTVPVPGHEFFTCTAVVTCANAFYLPYL